MLTFSKKKSNGEKYEKILRLINDNLDGSEGAFSI